MLQYSFLCSLFIYFFNIKLQKMRHLCFCQCQIKQYGLYMLTSMESFVSQKNDVDIPRRIGSESSYVFDTFTAGDLW